jgi:hypothetical protein
MGGKKQEDRRPDPVLAFIREVCFLWQDLDARKTFGRAK